MSGMEIPREPTFYPIGNIFEGNTEENNVFAKERKMLHRQLELLAEQSKGCSPQDLAALSEQMVAIYSVLNQL